MKHFQQIQESMTRFVRDPDTCSGPEGIEARRMAIYRDLFFNNIEGFLSNGFPVCRSLYCDEAWHSMVRDFMRRHCCQSPYFLQIAEEFLAYLSEERDSQTDPVFLRELAHYEWVELALDIAEQELPPAVAVEDVLKVRWAVSPLAWSLAYQFPVQHISGDFQPTAPSAEPTFIVVYRNRQDEVQFLEINQVTARLLSIIVERPELNGAEILAEIAHELHVEYASVVGFGSEILAQMWELDILLVN
jgi:hypothetical protein